MQIAIGTPGNNLGQRLDQVDQRYFWAQEQLANAASYETLREMPEAREQKLRQALRHIRRAERQAYALRNEID